MSASAPASFVSFNEAVHCALAEVFGRHQESLLDRDLGGARAGLDHYRTLLLRHMNHEEECLLPMYEEHPRAGERAGSVFRLEHRQIREHLERIGAELAGLAPEPRPVLALLDRETTFKSLMDHHDRREQGVLYPALDEQIPEPERRTLLAELWREWGPPPA